MICLGPMIVAAAVGLSLVAGAAAAAFSGMHNKLAAQLTAFGGGILFAAVALELVPDADSEAGTTLTALGLIGGAVVYVAVDGWLENRSTMRREVQAAAAGMPNAMDVTRGKLIAVGLIVDGIPESLALGITVAEGEVGVALLVGVLLGNLVESYGAAQPIVAGGQSRGYAIGLMALIGVALAAATLVGGTVDLSGDVVGTLQAVAAGAVVAVLSIAIVPHAFDEVKGTVAVATILGFTLGYLLS